MALRCSGFLLFSVLLVAVPEVRSAGFLRVRSVPSKVTQAVTSTDDTNKGTKDMIDKSVETVTLGADDFEGQLIGQVDAVEEDAEAAEGASDSAITQVQNKADDAKDKPAPMHHDAVAPEAPKKAVQPPVSHEKKAPPTKVIHEEKAPPTKPKAPPTKLKAPPTKPRGTYNYITGEFQHAASLVQLDEEKFAQSLIQMGKKDDSDEEANDDTEEDEDESSQDEEGTADEEEQTEDESSQDSEEGQIDEAQEEDSDEVTDEDNQDDEDTEEQTSEGDDEKDAADEDNGESDDNAEEENSEDDNDEDN